ncbi:SUMF1/EgtB/PvdO family nonheme iron enzyme [Azospirillum griseum]|uniref:Serine protease n=1 Tax=Azospirillum griseum TaxID=2496639 RepID=A0A431VBB0_9PROT|nr:SUMF1/EgtB/PvdO family nonheme iron enzyme [Azospirillum griseum]RTR15669.1 trypsin-like serine protease [Azospirillum griseum]
MILRLCAIAALLIGVGLSSASARADEVRLSRDYFDRKVWHFPQAVTGGAMTMIQRGNFESMASYQSGRYHRSGQAVGRVQILTASNETSACTGWLIAKDRVMTNHHCVVGTTPATRALDMKLALGVVDGRTEAEIPLLGVALPPLESNADLDYAILRVEGDTSRFPSLPLNHVRDPRPGEALFLIGHPGGASQHIIRRDCLAVDRRVPSGLEFAHRCDSIPGNSGSPVFADDDGALVGLHHSGDTQANFAIRMEEIKRSSRIFASLVGSGSKPILNPRTVNDRWEKLEGGKTYRLPVLENDVGAVGGGLRVVAVGPMAKGRAEVAADGQEILYTAPTDAAGDVTFSYRVREEGGGEAEGTVTLSLQTAPSGPRVIRDCAECPEMVVVPPGNFMMGSPEDERGRSQGEGPQHRVTIGQAFAVGRYAVTFEEWDACVRDGGCGGYRPGDEGWGRGRRPVIHVSWHDAKSYAAWLSRKTGQSYRLLSESEREYVTRAGTTTPFNTGYRITTDQANFDGTFEYNGRATDVYRRRTAEVGSFKPNAFGLYDLHGNVWEWVEDCWHADYQGAPADGSAWTAGTCEGRVLRGGSWYNAPSSLLSAFRYWNPPNYRIFNRGFRVARTLLP